MAFVTIANYSQASFEMGYALKFMRVILLILTSLLNVWGFVLGTVIAVCSIVFNARRLCSAQCAALTA